MLLHILRRTIKTESALCVVSFALPPRCVLNLNIASSVVAKTKHRKYRNCDRPSQLLQRDSYAVETPGTDHKSQASSISPAWPEVADHRSQVATVHS
jgi:hypothetical protein